MGVLPHLKQSACGLSLESASKVIGFILLALRCLAIILFTTSYLAVQQLKDQHEENINRMDEKFGGSGFQGQDSIKVFNEERLFKIVMTIQITVLVFLAIFDVLMLVGVYKRRASFIFPWVVMQMIAVCLAILNLLRISHAGDQVLSSLIAIACTCYFILVVNSHHNNLKSQQASPNI